MQVWKLIKISWGMWSVEKIILPVSPAPATPKIDPTIATPAVLAIAAALAPPNIVPIPAPIKGAANPPVNPIRVPPAIVATPTDAYRLILRILSRFLVALSSALQRIIIEYTFSFQINFFSNLFKKLKWFYSVRSATSRLNNWTSECS